MRLGDEKPPAMLAPVPPERVARASVEAVRRDRAEAIATAGPVRPILTLASLWPRLGERFMRTAGVTRMWAGIARKRGRDRRQ